MIKYTGLLMILILMLGCGKNKKNAEKPNIIIILADDMGFSDIGCFGSEISTPNLDMLASEGLRMTQMYNAARCCPSRASLLTGLYPHQAGMGSMVDQEISLPGYQGYLPESAVTISEVLKPAGYNNYQVGKWHVGEAKEHWPFNYAFDKSFGLLNGASSYYDFLPYRNEEWPWSDPEIINYRDSIKLQPADTLHYATDLYTDYAIQYIKDNGKQKPFFMYLAYTAPHWPLHALPEDIAKYEGKYMGGWDSIREIRYIKLLGQGIIKEKYANSPKNEKIGDWESLSEKEKKAEDRKMAVYAAMVDRMDQNIGRLLETLKETGHYNNTMIVFLSDNGASSAGMVPYLDARFSDEAPIGSPQSFPAYGISWANVSNTPFRQFKGHVHEGGIATPFVAWYPGVIKQGIDHTPGHIIDLMPTIRELAGASYPTVYNGNNIQPEAGTSMLKVMKGEETIANRELNFEHHGHSAIIKDKYKMVQLKDNPWELYNLQEDRTELNNLIKDVDHSVLNSLFESHYEWSTRIGVYPYDVVINRVIMEEE